MKKALLVSLLVFSANGMAAACDLNGDWQVVQSHAGVGPVRVQEADIISLRHTGHPSAPRQHQVYHLNHFGENYVCESEEITDARFSLPQGLVVGSFPRVSCTFTADRELMQFTAVLVKDGQAGTQRCAQGFFGHQPDHPFFADQAFDLENSCYSGHQCLIYWRVNSLDYPSNEGSEQGTGGNDGGNTG